MKEPVPPRAPPPDPAEVRVARLAGALVQGLVLGVLLYAAVAQLVAVGVGARVFQYQAW